MDLAQTFRLKEIQWKLLKRWLTWRELPRRWKRTIWRPVWPTREPRVMLLVNIHTHLAIFLLIIMIYFPIDFCKLHSRLISTLFGITLWAISSCIIFSAIIINAVPSRRQPLQPCSIITDILLSRLSSILFILYFPWSCCIFYLLHTFLVISMFSFLPLLISSTSSSSYSPTFTRPSNISILCLMLSFPIHPMRHLSLLL